jgi:cyclomaltodextrinase / maltogenic alpha-amylase / neopullulanase
MNKIVSICTALLLIFTYVSPKSVNAQQQTSIEDESIYDLLVDRFFNGTGMNDYNVDAKNPASFSGGDFKGLQSKKDFIKQMGFSIISIGNVFENESYDGSKPVSYENMEPHFGTKEEFEQVISTFNASDMDIMIDFPVAKVSKNHEWFSGISNVDWVKDEDEHYIWLNTENSEIQRNLKAALAQVVKEYNVHIRFTSLEMTSESFLNELIDIVKKENPHAYVISSEQSNANFDVAYDDTMVETQVNAFKNVDLPTDQVITNQQLNVYTQRMIDTLSTDRFILYGDLEKMYPPTRAKMAVLSNLLLPGLPVVTYGTEIAMSGTAGTQAHQLYNFKTDTELLDQIKNIQQLKMESETLRKGQVEILINEDGYIAFSRTSSDEKWIVVINNTSSTKTLKLSKEEIGEDKKIIALLNTENIRLSEDDHYHIVLDRENVEVYHIQNDQGINKAYLVALALVYILFMIFVIAVVKKGKKQKGKKEA